MTENLPAQSIVAITHDHAMYSIAVRRSKGESAVFSNYFAPLARQGGVNVIGMVMGGDPPLHGVQTNDAWWGSLELLDMLWQEANESHDTLRICLDWQDIEETLAETKIAVIPTLEGGLALDQGPHKDPLLNLRTLYRLGVRSLQFLGQAWNCLMHAEGDEIHSKGLTPLGEETVREMNRLGMVIDMAHTPDPDPLFWDVLETSQDPIIDSHRCTRGANDIPRNISDERVKAIAETGGLIGIQFFSVSLGSKTGGQSTVDDVLRHIDHIVRIAGVEYVALGPDFLESALTSRAPDHYAQGIDEISGLSRVKQALTQHGYSEADVNKITGENILRVYRQVIG